MEQPKHPTGRRLAEGNQCNLPARRIALAFAAARSPAPSAPALVPRVSFTQIKHVGTVKLTQCLSCVQCLTSSHWMPISRSSCAIATVEAGFSRSRASASPERLTASYVYPSKCTGNGALSDVRSANREAACSAGTSKQPARRYECQVGYEWALE
jgi:hypothetical protein